VKQGHASAIAPETAGDSTPPGESPQEKLSVLILFFSGTGNTQFVAEYLRDHVLDAGCVPNCTITLAALEWASPGVIENHDILCLGFPVYEGRAPRNVRDFIERLPVVHGKGAFVFNTKGAVQGSANRSVVRRLAAHGFRPLGCASLMLPASDGISMMLRKDSRTFNKYLERDFSHLRGADRLVRRIRDSLEMLRQKRDVNEIPRRSAWTVFGFASTGVLRLLYLALGVSRARQLRATDACTRCGLCVKQCPTRNITMEKTGMSFADRCVLCLRCVNNCPEEAVQVGSYTLEKARWHGPGGGYEPLRYKTPRTSAPRTG
jgi:ferredoxin